MMLSSAKNTVIRPSPMVPIERLSPIARQGGPGPHSGGAVHPVHDGAGPLALPVPRTVPLSAAQQEVKAMRVEASVTSVSWIPSEAVTGAVLKGTFESGVTHYDDPP